MFFFLVFFFNCAISIKPVIQAQPSGGSRAILIISIRELNQKLVLDGWRAAALLALGAQKHQTLG